MSELVSEATLEEDAAADVPVTVDELDSDVTVGALGSEELGADDTVEVVDELVLCDVLLAGIDCSVTGVDDIVVGADELVLVGAEDELVTGVADDIWVDDDATVDDRTGELLDDGTGAAEELGAAVTVGVDVATDGTGATDVAVAVGCSTATVAVGTGAVTTGSGADAGGDATGAGVVGTGTAAEAVTSGAAVTAGASWVGVA